MTGTTVVELPMASEQQNLPNKFGYPEFAGFVGEKHLKKILRRILPLALYRTWEILVDNQAYDNDCFMSVDNLADLAERAPKTIQANLAELAARKLLELRAERKVFVQNERIYSRPVVIKDFTGLYALAHEYDQWCQNPGYIEPDRAYAAMIKADPRLEAKLRRFNNYRRILYTQLTGPEAKLSPEARWSQDYCKDGEVDQAEVANTCLPCPKKLSKQLPKMGQNESNTYSNSQKGDSLDSDLTFEHEEAGTMSHTSSQKQTLVAPDYTKRSKEQNLHHESQTNPVPSFPSQNMPRAGKTCEREEEHPDVQWAQGAMTAIGVMPERSARRQAEELPPPPKHPLARSFVHEVAGLFGDLNEKGSKTGIERTIETFALEPAEVLLCLVRAYTVTRDTKAEKIRNRRPDGAANRMPLFCTMFKRFAQALGPGSKWQYPWEQMLEDIAADDRLSLWLSEHRAELVSESNTRENPPVLEEGEEPEQESLEKREEGAGQAENQGNDQAGWSDRVEAYRQGERLMQAIVDASYVNVAVALREAAGRFYVVFKVQGEGELVLSTEEEIAYLMEQAELGRL
jgi:hypothetical protein